MQRFRGLLVAALVAASLAAVPASASATTGIKLLGSPETLGGISAEKYPTTVSGGLPGSPWINWATVLQFPAGEEAWVVSCDGVKYSGPTLKEITYSFALGATYSTCHIGPVGSISPTPVTVSMNSCSYVYSEIHGDSTKNEFESAAEIACNEGDGITIGVGPCILKIPSQALGGGETLYSNLGSGKTATVLEYTSASGMEYQMKPKAACTAAFEMNGTQHNGSSVADMMLSGL